MKVHIDQRMNQIKCDTHKNINGIIIKTTEHNGGPKKVKERNGFTACCGKGNVQKREQAFE